MTREEFSLIWHDWLRGVTLICALLVLVAIHFLHIFSPPDYAILVVSIALLVGLVMAASVCFSRLAPVLVRAVAPLLATVGALVGFAGVFQTIYLPEPYATATVSTTSPTTTLVVPTDGLGESYLRVTNRPGASPSGKDKNVEVRLDLSGPGVKRSLKLEFFKNKTAKGGKGSTSLGLRNADALLLEGLEPGGLQVTIGELKPETALPMELSLHWPMVPPSLLRLALYVVLALALLLSPFIARRGEFPFILPFAIVLAVTYWFIGQGIPPRQPLLPLLGIILGGGIAGSGVGYGLAKGMQLLLRPRDNYDM